MKTSTWIIVILLIVVALYGLFRISGGERTQTTEGTEEISLVGEVTDIDHSKGGVDARAVLVEYGDFQCPACRSFFPVIQQLSVDYGDDLLVVYRHFPLRQVHPNAQLAAQVSEAADLQRKFWSMHDLLYEEQPNWSQLSGNKAKDFFIELASRQGLDIEKFESDLGSKDVLERVKRDVDLGNDAGINSTPSIFLNGKKLTITSFDDIKTSIDNALREDTTDIESADTN